MRAEGLAGLLAFWLGAGCRSVEEPSLPPAPGPEAAAQPLTRAHCLELALQSVPTAAAWRARLDHARAALAGAQRLPNPSLALSFEDLWIPGAASVAPMQTTLMLGESLSELASRGRRSAAAEHELAAEEARLLGERDQLAADVSHAYDALVAQRARLALDREDSEIAATQRGAVGRLVELGESPRLELDRAQAECLESELQRAQDEAGARASEIELAFALGFDRPLELQLAEGFAPEHPELAGDLEQLIACAVRQSPRLEAASQDYHAALERAHLAASGVRFLPTVLAGPRNVEGDTSAVVELEAELPLFDQGQSEHDAASADLLAAAAAVRAAAHEVAREVSIAYSGSAAARKALEEQARPLAEQRAAIRLRTQVQFEAGEASYLELVGARRDEIEARVGVLEAELQISAAQTELARVIGTVAGAH